MIVNMKYFIKAVFVTMILTGIAVSLAFAADTIQPPKSKLTIEQLKVKIEQQQKTIQWQTDQILLLSQNLTSTEKQLLSLAKHVNRIQKELLEGRY